MSRAIANKEIKAAWEDASKHLCLTDLTPNQQWEVYEAFCLAYIMATKKYSTNYYDQFIERHISIDTVIHNQDVIDKWLKDRARDGG